MNCILFDSDRRIHLLPLTYTRPCADLRLGILTIREKWEKYLQTTTSSVTENYLSRKFPCQTASDNLLINGCVLPNEALLCSITALEVGQALYHNNLLIAYRCDASGIYHHQNEMNGYQALSYQQAITHIQNPWDLFTYNAAELELDFDLITQNRKSASLPSSNTILGERFFAEESAVAECAIFNTRSGAIYLGEHSEVMEGSVVRGALALCEHAALKLSTKIYGATTIGPHSKVGGEVNNSILIGYSNKGHDGFLGNSVIGEWCNLGADTNNSNLKNNYAEVKVWSYAKKGFVKTGLQFCGLLMGDHSKSGINTMFNTGTVVGVSANIFGAGFPRNFIPSFSWGGAQGMETFTLNKADEVAEKMMQRRGIEYDEIEREIMAYLYEHSAEYRVWDHKP